jgi:predicted RNA-binding Zn ribbon-like protein
MEKLMTISASNFLLLGGVPCLDFVNTKNWHVDESPQDFLINYTDLLQWSLQLNLITMPEARQLSKLAGQQAQKAQSVVEQARSLRETIYRIFFSISNAQGASAPDLEYFNDVWTHALANLRVQPDHRTFQWKWVGMDEELGSMLWPILLSAAELLVSEKLGRVKSCEGCGWLFLDTTKSGRRHWCDMRICGNRAKARRHYARSRGLPAGIV